MWVWLWRLLRRQRPFVPDEPIESNAERRDNEERGREIDQLIERLQAQVDARKHSR